MRDGKGQKDRVTPLPAAVEEALCSHLRRVRTQHDLDMAAGFGRVALPYSLARKYPHADRDWAWQWVFPASRRPAVPLPGAAIDTTSTSR